MQLKTLAQAIETLRGVDGEMTIREAAAFLVVASKEGLALYDIAAKLNIPDSSVSRIMANLSKVNPRKGDGADLVTLRADDFSLRKKVAELSPKGRKLLEQLQAL